MEEALYALLAADAGITAALASTGNIFWIDRQQASGFPAMVMTRISGVRNYLHAGADGLVQSRVQFDCQSLAFLTTKTIVRALRNKLSGFSNINSGGIFQGCFIDGGDRDTFDDSPATDKVYRTSVDYLIFHKEL